MEEVTKQFGIQWPLLAASLVNFFILLFLLKRFLYAPVLKVLDERKGVIEKSLKDAQEIEDSKKLTEERVKASLRLANEQSLKALEQARRSATQIKEDMVKEAEAQARQIVEKARAEISQERDEAAKLLRKEAAGLIAQSINQMMPEMANGQINDKLVRQTLEKIDG